MNKRTVIKTSIIILVIAIIIAAFFVIQSIILSGIYFEDQKNEQVMYNSMSFSDKLVYNKIRYDRNFGFAIGRFYEKNVEKRKKVIINEKETELFYCFSIYDQPIQCDYNPENININFKYKIYIDNSKNIFIYNDQNILEKYRMYNVYNYQPKKNAAKISQDEAFRIGASFCKDIVSGLNDDDMSAYNYLLDGYAFYYNKSFSDLFSITSMFSVTGDGRVSFVSADFNTFTKKITVQEESDVLNRLDKYIKTRYASRKYEIADKTSDIIFYSANNEYYVLFTVTFPAEGDAEQQQETILLKIK